MLQDRMMKLAVILLCTSYVLCKNNNSSQRIVIVGAGAAGIGAASRLFANGFKNVTILEAENRIGGRVHSMKLGEYMIDLGAEWDHGEMGTGEVAHELAWPEKMFQRVRELHSAKSLLFTSTGTLLLNDTVMDIQRFLSATGYHLRNNKEATKINKSLGEFVDAEFEIFFKNHTEINANLRNGIVHYLGLIVLSFTPADTFYQLPLNSHFHFGVMREDEIFSTSDRTYINILNILTEKYPPTDEELLVLNNTLLNNKVTKINYQQPDDTIKVTTKNGREYTADHVIVTTSLGVLKAKYEELFEPPLPEKKINSIENIGYGHVGKIVLYYDDPWWPMDGDVYIKCIIWTDEDRRQLEHDPERSWMLGVAYFFHEEHRPKRLNIWLNTNHSTAMERVPEEKFHNQIDELIDRFFGRTYNLTKPTAIMRTEWNTNENFRGAYSYRSLEDTSWRKLAKPIVKERKPIVQFAGEATSDFPATVYGAIQSGWRSANRLINFYARKG